MSSKESSSHPFNAFLTKYCVEASHIFVMERGIHGKIDASKNLLWLIAWLERDAKANLEKELKELRGTITLTSDEEQLWNTISNVANVLHDSGYFLAAKSIGRSDKSEKNEAV